MAISRKELKAAARQQIKGNVATFFGLSVILALISMVSGILVFGPLVLMGPLALGSTMFILEVVRTKDGKFETGFKGFKQFGSAFVASLLMNIFILLWSLLLFVPALIADLRYSMTYFIIADNPGISGMAAIKKSKEMMKGHKWELFVLRLSFFWWLLLVSITFGLAAIYVVPYMHATTANYYEKLKSECAAQPVPAAPEGN